MIQVVERGSLLRRSISSGMICIVRDGLLFTATSIAADLNRWRGWDRRCERARKERTTGSLSVRVSVIPSGCFAHEVD